MRQGKKKGIKGATDLDIETNEKTRSERDHSGPMSECDHEWGEPYQRCSICLDERAASVTKRIKELKAKLKEAEDARDGFECELWGDDL